LALLIEQVLINKLGQSS